MATTHFLPKLELRPKILPIPKALIQRPLSFPSFTLLLRYGPVLRLRRLPLPPQKRSHDRLRRGRRRQGPPELPAGSLCRRWRHAGREGACEGAGGEGVGRRVPSRSSRIADAGDGVSGWLRRRRWGAIIGQFGAVIGGDGFVVDGNVFAAAMTHS